MVPRELRTDLNALRMDMLMVLGRAEVTGVVGIVDNSTLFGLLSLRYGNFHRGRNNGYRPHLRNDGR
jgi:hypothetical protein